MQAFQQLHFDTDRSEKTRFNTMAFRPVAPMQILTTNTVSSSSGGCARETRPVPVAFDALWRRACTDRMACSTRIFEEQFWLSSLRNSVQFRHPTWFPGLMAVEMSPEAQRAGRLLFQDQGSPRETFFFFMGHSNPVTSCHLATDAVTNKCHGLG